MKLIILCILILATFFLESVVLASDRPDCIGTLHEFQQSLVNRTVNLDSLSRVFSPANRKPSISFAVHYHFCSNNLTDGNTTDIQCKDIEKWVSDINFGRHPKADFSGRYAYKLEWNASPINLFIRPQLLANMSLFTLKINYRTTHLILDQMCEEIIQSAPKTDLSTTCAEGLDLCHEPPSILLVLQQLTVDLKSFHLHKESFFTQGIKVAGREQGYPTYYIRPENSTNEVCVLEQFDEYKKRRYILLAAVVVNEILILLAIPFTGRFYYTNIKKRFTKDLNTGYYFLGFNGAMIVLGLAVLVNDIILIINSPISQQTYCISDVKNNYLAGIISTGLFILFAIVIVFYNAWLKNRDGNRHWYYKIFLQSWTFVLTTLILVISFGFAFFHGVFIFMALIAAPIEVGSLLLLYLTALFVLAMFLALIVKGCNENFDLKSGKDYVIECKRFKNPESPNRLEEETVESGTKGAGKKSDSEDSKVSKCLRIIDGIVVFFIVLIFFATLILYLTFYYLMAITMEPYTTEGGFLESFGTLLPAIFASIIGFLAKKFITFITDEKENNSAWISCCQHKPREQQWISCSNSNQGSNSGSAAANTNQGSDSGSAAANTGQGNNESPTTANTEITKEI